MAKKSSLQRGGEPPRSGRGRPRKYDPASAVLWWKSHGKPSARVVAEALGIPHSAAWQALRDHPEYGGRKQYAGRPQIQADTSVIVSWWKSHDKPSAGVVGEALGISRNKVWRVLREDPEYVGRKYQRGRPKNQARRAAIVAWWREHGKPRLLDVAWEFGITGERVRQILNCESDYDRGGQGPTRQAVRDTLETHPEWTPAKVALESGCSTSLVQSIARNLGHKFPATERPAYTPRGRVLRIIKLHNQGLRRPDIAKRLGIRNCIVFMTLDRVIRRSPKLLEIPIVDGRRVGPAAKRKPTVRH